MQPLTAGQALLRQANLQPVGFDDQNLSLNSNQAGNTCQAAQWGLTGFVPM